MNVISAERGATAADLPALLARRRSLSDRLHAAAAGHPATRAALTLALVAVLDAIESIPDWPDAAAEIGGSR